MCYKMDYNTFAIWGIHKPFYIEKNHNLFTVKNNGLGVLYIKKE